MGTRSVIAVPVGTTWRGRYCHWDGYPDHMLGALSTIVGRDGVDTARRILTEEHYGWSSIDPSYPGEYDFTEYPKDVADLSAFTEKHGRSAKIANGPGFELVAGYGEAYTAVQGVSGGGADKNEWIEESDKESWCEYAYILHLDHIEVIEL